MLGPLHTKSYKKACLTATIIVVYWCVEGVGVWRVYVEGVCGGYGCVDMVDPSEDAPIICGLLLALGQIAKVIILWLQKSSRLCVKCHKADFEFCCT